MRCVGVAAALASIAIFTVVREARRYIRFNGNRRPAAPLPHDLLAMLAHELRTPLNSIVGWTRVLQSGKADTALTATALRTIASSAQTQRRLIDDLVDTTRAEHSEIPLRVEILDLRTPVCAAVDALRPSAESSNLCLSLASPSTPCTVEGDSERLQQAFGNIVANAVKFTRTGGVHVEIASQDHSYEVSVIDTGKGIEREFLPFVFTRFKQADRSGRRQDGLGLGLAICRDLIARHRGRVHVSSQGPGHGTTVVVRVPAFDVADPDSR